MNQTLCVTYDLSQPGRNYEQLIAALKAYPSWWHHLESTWFIVTPKSAADVRDELWKLLDRNDKLLVFRPTTPWAANGLPAEACGWLKTNVP